MKEKQGAIIWASTLRRQILARLKIALNVQCMNLVMIKVSRLDVIDPAGTSVFQTLFSLQEVLTYY